ncbi:unnamed protein product [Haemonchus placei]|uniref:WD_REPEATS_REGION domain-containing protein n=1 Tax=Haemonchus placei TaxID=6290 RepID=A0A0N4W2C7_HAEPC|nr:unnamed protein product [Haemonchus placei]
MGECLMFGLDLESRYLSNVPAEEDVINLLIGTHNIKMDNQICRLSLDGEYSRISSLSFPHTVGEVRGLAASPSNADIVASASANCESTFFMGLPEKRPLSGTAHAQTWNPHGDGNSLGLAIDKDIACHDLRAAGESLRIKDAHAHRALHLDFNPNLQHVVASCGDDGAVRLWDWRNPNSTLVTVTPHAHWAWQVRFHPVHDQLILSAGSDATVVLSCVVSASSEVGDLGLDDTTEGEETDKLEDGQLERIEEHEESVYACLWAAADPWTFASLSYDGRVVISRVSRKHKYALMKL